MMVVEWSGAAPGDHAEYLVDPAAPDVPVAFAYRALDGTRLGVIASSGAVKRGVARRRRRGVEAR